MSSNDAILDEALASAMNSVFAHYGVPLSAAGPSPSISIGDHDAVGVIGFIGERLRGTLVIATSTTVVARACPATAREIPLRDRVRDWVGELSNLVLGQIKLTLGHHGVTLGLSTPVAFTGEHLRLGAVLESRTRALDFTSPYGGLRAWLEVESDATLVLTPGPTPDDEPTVGEPLLF